MIKSAILSMVIVASASAGDVQRIPAEKRIDISNLGFIDNSGKKCIVGDFKGKVVVVDFWVKWCGPCRRSLPEIHALQKEGLLKDNLVVIPCNLDDEDWPLGVKMFIKRNQKVLDGFVYYRPGIGKHGIATNLGEDVQSYPTTIVVDQNGRLASRWSGYGDGLLVSEINRILQEKQ